MAKKKEKGKKNKDAAGPREAVRGAVESTFQAAAGGASKAQEVLDDVTSTLKSLRDANLVETLEGIRDELQSLARRVASLELRSGDETKPAALSATRRVTTATARKPAARKPAARKPAAKKPAAKKPAARKPAASKSAATKSAASKPAAKKPAASRSSTARKPASTRRTSTSRKSGS